MVKVGAFYALGKKKAPYTDLAAADPEGGQGVRRRALHVGERLSLPGAGRAHVRRTASTWCGSGSTS